MLENETRSRLSRRRFLPLSAMGSSAIILAACGAQAPAPAAEAEPDPTATPEPEPTATPEPEPEPAAEAAPEISDEDVEVIVADVTEYQLSSDEWAGGYGSVTFMLHEAVHNGEPAYFIRTDASDEAFAQEVGLVYVPLLNAGAAMDPTNTMYVFSDDRKPVIEMIPTDENFSSLFKYMPVEVTGSDVQTNSVEDVMAAAEAGDLTIDDSTNIFVNYPLIQWAGGGQTVDTELTAVLPGGQLFAEPDLDNMTVTMKLHQCYPGSCYILTDTGAAPMAPMMNISASSPTNQLKDLGGTDEIWVFGNGLVGPGVMGFQPAIFDNKAGEAAWSPFWDHFTCTWADESAARLLTNSDEIRELIDSGDLNLFNGVPDSHPNGFVVNCPAPILAPNDYVAPA